MLSYYIKTRNAGIRNTVEKRIINGGEALNREIFEYVKSAQPLDCIRDPHSQVTQGERGEGG